VAFSADGHPLMAADTKNVGGPHQTLVTLWDISTGQYRFRFKIPLVIVAATLSPEGRFIATGGGGSGPEGELWNATTGARIAQLSDEHPQRFRSQPVIGAIILSRWPSVLMAVAGHQQLRQLLLRQQPLYLVEHHCCQRDIRRLRCHY